MNKSYAVLWESIADHLASPLDAPAKLTPMQALVIQVEDLQRENNALRARIEELDKTLTRLERSFKLFPVRKG